MRVCVLVEEVLHVVQARLPLEVVDRQVRRVGQQQRGSAFAQEHHLGWQRQGSGRHWADYVDCVLRALTHAMCDCAAYSGPVSISQWVHLIDDQDVAD